MGLSRSTTVLIALGSNLGDREENLSRACHTISQQSAIEDLHASSWHSTAPIGGPSQGEFLNGAACFRTELSLPAIFRLLQQTERQLGRETVERWGPRLIDLDLLLCGDEVVEATGKSDLVVPHPRMAFRNFVLRPACEVAPQMRHPVIGWTIAELWQHLQHCPPYVAFVFQDRKRGHELCERVRAVTGAERIADASFKSFSPATGSTMQVVWCAATDQRPSEIPERPKLVIADFDINQKVHGPAIDVSQMPEEQAEIEIAAAIDAMQG